MKRLSARQDQFVREYVLCWNGAEAARRAGYSHDRARNVAHELRHLKEYSHVQAALRKAIADTNERRETQWAAQTDLFMQTIMANPQNLKNEATGDWLPLELMDEDDAKQIVSIQENEYENEGGQKGRTVSFKFQNRLEAAKLLGKHNGYFADRTSVGETGPYRDAEASLDSVFDRIRRRTSEPIPGAVDDGAAPGS